MKSNDTFIRELAYQIWEAEGRPQGQAERHWTLARLKMAQTKNGTHREPGRPFDPSSATGSIESGQPDQT